MVSECKTCKNYDFCNKIELLCSDLNKLEYYRSLSEEYGKLMEIIFSENK